MDEGAIFRSSREHLPTDYYGISEEFPELKGDLTGEIIDESGVPTLHLARPRGRRFSRAGYGDIVVIGISNAGWTKIQEVIAKLGAKAGMREIKQALASSEVFTWDKTQTGR